MEQEWILIYNPLCAGGAKQEKNKLRQIEQQLHQMRIVFRTLKTTAPGDARSIVKKYISEHGCRKVMVAGGDGTLNEVVNGIFDCEPEIKSTDVALACIPLGNGNDWAKTIDIPTDIEKAVKTIKLGTYFYQDVGVLHYTNELGSEEKRIFINVAGIGLEALVVKSVQKLKRKGKSNVNYQWHLLKQLGSYKGISARVFLNGELWHEGPLFNLSFGICRYNGNGMIPHPEALPDDGLIDSALIKPISALTVLKYKSELYDGSYINRPFVNHKTGTNFAIESEKTFGLEADGEYLGTGPVKLTIRHHALKILSTLKNKME
jgi:YegS/Rv2252/BmrU family lipid kinase